MAEVTISESIELDAPIEEVFDYRADFTTLPAYNPHVTNVRATGDGEFAFDLTLPGMDEPMQTPLRIVSADRPRSLIIETGPGYMAREVCTFEAAGSGTRLTFQQTISFEGDVPQDALDAVGAQAAEQARLELELIKKNLG